MAIEVLLHSKKIFKNCEITPPAKAMASVNERDYVWTPRFTRTWRYLILSRCGHAMKWRSEHRQKQKVVNISSWNVVFSVIMYIVLKRLLSYNDVYSSLPLVKRRTMVQDRVSSLPVGPSFSSETKNENKEKERKKKMNNLRFWRSPVSYLGDVFPVRWGLSKLCHRSWSAGKPLERPNCTFWRR